MKRTSISLFGVLLAVAMAACSNTPTGPADANGRPAIITNPLGRGPQVLRWGPPNVHEGESPAGH